MLKIVDLNRNEELSASAMGKVAGGIDCQQGQSVGSLYAAAGAFFKAAGFTDIGNYLDGEGTGIFKAACYNAPP